MFVWFNKWFKSNHISTHTHTHKHRRRRTTTVLSTTKAEGKIAENCAVLTKPKTPKEIRKKKIVVPWQRKESLMILQKCEWL